MNASSHPNSRKKKEGEEKEEKGTAYFSACLRLVGW
jgi:hypothetical protein